MQLPTDWGTNFGVQYYRVSDTKSPYYHRDRAGCNYVSQGDTTGVSFTTTDPNRTLCTGCEGAS